ncbi:hypothetical protein E5676_scaffold507G00280 [Cucumis melo var. makuwa]|uniref:Uncharacterized protein n=1 Tax=Cucumis melo var. makuwa TaxID=1194695 RepID=A0A5D3BHA6_CUCMM|nr:hypothetical protein E5676_scaffold507G00280 [Cucumis melo var. makuwa]
MQTHCIGYPHSHVAYMDALDQCVCIKYKGSCIHSVNRIRKWSIPDAEKDVDIKNVGNKGFSDALNTTSREASGKHSFPMHHVGVDKYSSGKSLKRRENRLMSIGNSPVSNAFWGISRRCGTGSGNPFFNRFSSVFYITETERGKERRSREPSPFPSPFRRCSAAVSRRCPSSPSTTLEFRVI